MTDDGFKRAGYPEGRMPLVDVVDAERGEPEPQPGALDDDLMPNWRVLDGVACSWRLVAIFDPNEPGLMLLREVWRAPVRGHGARWYSDPGRTIGLSAQQTAKLIEVLGLPRRDDGSSST